MVPGAKLPNERDLAQQLNTSRTAVRSALAMMDRQGLVLRRVGSGCVGLGRRSTGFFVHDALLRSLGSAFSRSSNSAR